MMSLFYLLFFFYTYLRHGENLLPLHRGLDNMCTNMSFALGKNTL